MDFEDAKSKTKAAGWTGLVIAGLTALVVIGAMASGSEELSYFADPWIFADVILATLLSVGVLLRSRIAAILLLLYYLFSKIVMFLEFGEAKGIFATLLISAVFARGIQGAFGEPTRITVFPDRGKNFKLRVPQNGDQDQEFFETLQQRWKESKSGLDAIFSGS